MEDTRTCRQIVIDRIKSYADGILYWAPDDVREYDFDNMTDAQVVKTFELLVFDYVRIRNEYRANNPDPRLK